MRCYWCDNDKFDSILEGGEIIEYGTEIAEDAKVVDYRCDWCSHLVSEGNPRAGDPEETVETLKEERDDLRVQLEACQGEATEGPNGPEIVSPT